MPKITTEKVHRLHISLLHSDYVRISQLAQENHTSISEILRTCVTLLANSKSKQIEALGVVPKGKTIPLILNLEF